MTRFLLLSGLLVALVVPNVLAQAGTHDELILQFEITRNGSVVGKSTLRMRVGGKVSMAMNNVPRMAIELARHDGISEAICEFEAGDSKPILRMKLSQEPRSAKVLIGKDIFEVKIALTQSR